MKTKLKLMVFVATLVTGVSKAQLYFQNTAENPIQVSIAYYVKTNSYEGWYSRGWYEIDPGEKKKLIDGALEYQYYYFFAQDTRNNLAWQGGGKYNFIVDDEAFEIKNADKQYQLDNGTNRSFKAFKRINVSGVSYTLRLTEEED